MGTSSGLHDIIYIMVLELVIRDAGLVHEPDMARLHQPLNTTFCGLQKSHQISQFPVLMGIPALLR